MKLSNFIDGLNILKKYYKEIDDYHIGAEHDQFYAYETDYPLAPEDVQKLLDLGWFPFDQEEDAEYNPKAAWTAFV